jgi:hypothetical protein
METSNQNTDIEMGQTKVELTKESLNYFDQIRKWTTFFSILGFVIIGLLLIFGIFAGSIFSKFANANTNSNFPFFMIGFIYFIIAIIYFFPVLYLYRFSVSSKLAIKNNDPNEFAKAFKNLKSHYQFTGILTIIVLSIYLLIGIGFLIVKMVR